MAEYISVSTGKIKTRTIEQIKSGWHYDDRWDFIDDDMFSRLYVATGFELVQVSLVLVGKSDVEAITGKHERFYSIQTINGVRYDLIGVQADGRD